MNPTRTDGRPGGRLGRRWAAAGVFLVGLLGAVGPSAAETKALSGGSDELLVEAQSLLADRRLGELAVRMDGRILELLEGEGVEGAALTRLTAYRQFAALFRRLGRVEGRERATLRWLLAGRETERLLETFVLALSPQDDPEAALRVLARLYAEHGRSVAEFPELATALAVVYDAREDMSGESADAPDPAVASRLFSYYVRGRRSMRLDATSLPWPLSVFTVYNEVDEADLPWALRQFAGRQNIRDLYLDLALVERSSADDVVRGRPERWARGGREGGVAMTRLREIAASGGDTRERALYAVSVARALGIPAAVMLEASDTGRVLGWPALLELRDGRWTFDSDPKRFPELHGFGGQTMDPQAFRVISDAELGLLPRLLNTPAADRARALALVRLTQARQVENADGGRGSGDADDEPTRGRPLLLSDDEGRPDHTRRLTLLLAAAELSPGCREAWAAVREMGRRGEMTAAGLEEAVGAVGRLLVERHPDFALEVLLDAMSFRGSREQILLLDRVRRWFSGRPALLVKLHVRRADLLADSGRVAEALQHYAAVLEVAADAGPAAVEAMQRVDALLRRQGELPRLLSVYRQTWTSMAMPTSGSESARSTNWYRIGEAYAGLLEEMGMGPQARQVRQRLEVLERTGVQRGRR
ncbi:MAG: hypothetical protein ACK4PI_03980 [Tepidisphaerales bacterium]